MGTALKFAASIDQHPPGGEKKSGFLLFFGFFSRLIYPAFDGILKFLDALSHTATKIRQLARPENDQNNQQDKEQMGWLKQTFHFKAPCGTDTLLDNTL